MLFVYKDIVASEEVVVVAVVDFPAVLITVTVTY